MKYIEYLNLVDTTYPDMQIHLIPGPAPEILKIMAVKFFVEGTYDSELAIETRYQLNYLNQYGKHNFDVDTNPGSEPTEKPRISTSEFE